MATARTAYTDMHAGEKSRFGTMLVPIDEHNIAVISLTSMQVRRKEN